MALIYYNYIYRYSNIITHLILGFGRMKTWLKDKFYCWKKMPARTGHWSVYVSSRSTIAEWTGSRGTNSSFAQPLDNCVTLDKWMCLWWLLNMSDLLGWTTDPSYSVTHQSRCCWEGILQRKLMSLVDLQFRRD